MRLQPIVEETAIPRLLRLQELVLSAACVALVGGCRSEVGAESPTAPTGGQVAYKGQPLAQGTIIFTPDVGRPAYGEIEEGKIVRVTTYRPGDGAIVGQHKVTIQSVEKNSADPMAAKSLIPVRYADPETSGFTIRIEAGKPNEQDYNLTD